MNPLDTSPRRGYRMARKSGILPRHAVVLTAQDTLLQLRSYWKFHTLLGRPRRRGASS